MSSTPEHPPPEHPPRGATEADPLFDWKRQHSRPGFGPEDMYHNHKHEVWTPLNANVLKLFEDLKREAGSWAMFSEITGIKPRYMRFLRHGAVNKNRRGRQKTISLMLMDKITVAFDCTYRLREFPWYTTVQLVEDGVWKEHMDVRFFIDERNKVWAKRRAEGD